MLETPADALTAMPAEEPTPGNGHDSIGEDREDSERFEYTGEGFAEFRCTHARADIGDEAFRITIHPGSESATDVSIGIVTDTEEDEPYAGAVTTLSPEQADLLGYDLIAHAQEIRQRGEE